MTLSLQSSNIRWQAHEIRRNLNEVLATSQLSAENHRRLQNCVRQTHDIEQELENVTLSKGANNAPSEEG